MSELGAVIEAAKNGEEEGGEAAEVVAAPVEKLGYRCGHCRGCTGSAGETMKVRSRGGMCACVVVASGVSEGAALKGAYPQRTRSSGMSK